jgi:hypothetical protein
MATETKSIDTLFIRLVPKEVDTVTADFATDEAYWSFCRTSADLLYSSLPEKYKGDGLSERNSTNLGKRQGFYEVVGSSTRVVIGVIPQYRILCRNNEIINMPVFDLCTQPESLEEERAILTAAFNAFYLFANDRAGLGVVLSSEANLNPEDILRKYLPKGMKIEGRDDDYCANGRVTITL